MSAPLRAAIDPQKDVQPGAPIPAADRTLDVKLLVISRDGKRKAHAIGEDLCSAGRVRVGHDDGVGNERIALFAGEVGVVDDPVRAPREEGARRQGHTRGERPSHAEL